MKDDSSAIVNMLETMKKPESLSEETKKLWKKKLTEVPNENVTDDTISKLKSSGDGLNNRMGGRHQKRISEL